MRTQRKSAALPIGDKGPGAARRSSFGEALAYLAGVPSYHVLLAKAMLAGVGVWVFLNWLPLYFRAAYNMTLGAAGFAGTFMLQISTVIGIVVGGWLSDRAAAKGAKERMLVQGLSYLAAAPFLLLFLTRPGFTTVAIAVSAFSFSAAWARPMKIPSSARSSRCNSAPPRSAS